MRVYRPLEGSIAYRAIELLAGGPMRLTEMATHLNVTRQTLLMCMARAVEHGVVKKLPGARRPDGTGQTSTIYRLMTPHDAAFGATVRIVNGPGPMPRVSDAARFAANPFGIQP